MTAIHYPRWVESQPLYNLREVGVNLFVGGVCAISSGWRGIVCLYGIHENEGDPSAEYRERVYREVGRVLFAPVNDGLALPDTLFAKCLPFVLDLRLEGPVLIHCQAGLSRSASVAYAMLRCLDKLPHDLALARVKTPWEPAFPRPRTLQSAIRWSERTLSQAGIP